MIKRMGAAFLAVGMLGLAACGGGGDVATANKLKDRLCACTDQKCLDAVEKDAEAFKQSLKDKYKSKKDVPEDTMKQLRESGMAMMKCEMDLRQKLEAAGSGSGSGSGSATP